MELIASKTCNWQRGIVYPTVSMGKHLSLAVASAGTLETWNQQVAWENRDNEGKGGKYLTLGKRAKITNM